jgi:putative transposase
MPNHYHLVLEPPPEPNLVASLAWLQSTYTIRLNHRHKLFGHVFSGRYKAQLVEGSGDGYLRTACDYVHLNPARARLLGRDERLLSYPWSSLGYYLASPKHRPQWIRTDRLLGEHGIKRDTPEGRRQFEQQIEERRLEPGDEARLKTLRRGWCLGSPQFKNEMLQEMEGKLGDSHSGELRRENAQAKAERIVTEELKRLGWRWQDLEKRPKSDPAKLEIGARLRRETTLTIKAIAQRLHLGTSKSANIRLHEWMNGKRSKPK